MAILLRYISFGCLVFLALQQVATGLTCYVCSSCGPNSSGWTTISSSGSSSSWCTTYIYQFGSVSYTNRGLATSCQSGSDGMGGTMYCCSTDYCNGNIIVSGTGSISLSRSLGLIFALFAALYVFKTIMNN